MESSTTSKQISSCTVQVRIDRTGRADHRQSRALWLGQTDRKLSRTGAASRVEWASATAATQHQTRSSMLRFLLVEAAQVTVRSVPEWRSKYLHLLMRRGRKTAKVAMARRLAVRLYWMWRL